jgi:hypothetical protein
MKVNIALVFLGAVAASAIALPAQAATVFSTTVKGGGPIAYQIKELDVNGQLYNVDFDHGVFDPSSSLNPATASVYNGVFPTLPPAISATETPLQRANRIGAAILAVLATPTSLVNYDAAGNITTRTGSIPSITQVIERINTITTPWTFGGQTPSELYIPVSDNPTSVEHLTAYCVIPGGCQEAGTGRNPANDLMYAKFTPVTVTGTVPTPALIPGLLGMGLAALRKKKQAVSVAQEA